MITFTKSDVISVLCILLLCMCLSWQMLHQMRHKPQRQLSVHWDTLIWSYSLEMKDFRSKLSQHNFCEMQPMWQYNNTQIKIETVQSVISKLASFCPKLPS